MGISRACPIPQHNSNTTRENSVVRTTNCYILYYHLLTKHWRWNIDCVVKGFLTVNTDGLFRSMAPIWCLRFRTFCFDKLPPKHKCVFSRCTVSSYMDKIAHWLSSHNVYIKQNAFLISVCIFLLYNIISNFHEDIFYKLIIWHRVAWCYTCLKLSNQGQLPWSWLLNFKHV